MLNRIDLPIGQVQIEVIDDNEFEPDEQFYVKLSLVTNPTQGSKRASIGSKVASFSSANCCDRVILGRISIMEVTILNDDGQ